MNNHLNITDQDKKRFIEKTNTYIELRTTGLIMIDVVNDVISKYDGKKMNARVINAINDRFKETIDSSLKPCVWYDKKTYSSYNYICISARKDGQEVVIQLSIPNDNQIISKDTLSAVLNKYKESFNEAIEINRHTLENMDNLFKMLYDLETAIQNYANESSVIFRDMFHPFNGFLLY